MKYFDCIKQERFEELSSEQQLSYLQSEGIYVRIDSFSLPLDGTPVPMVRSDETKQIVPNKIVVDEFYQFVVQQFEPLITRQFYNFYSLFNEDKYGLKKSKRKQIALKHFKNHYETIATKIVAIVYERPMENGDTVLENMSKLAFLETGQNALKSDLSKTVLLQQFLFGNKDFFVGKLVANHKILRDIIKFEGTYKILSSLNSQYHFEGKAVNQPTKLKKTTGSSKEKTNPELQENPPSQALESSKNPLFGENNPNSNNKPVKKPSLISDKEAIDYLLKSVFGKKNNS